MNTQKHKNQPIVPVFYAADENYLPYLGVALRSLIDHANADRTYAVHVLTDGKLGKNARLIKGMETDNVQVHFHDVSKRIERIMHMLHCRDYYTPAIFYRLFIPDMFPQYEKAVYLDCDTVLCADIAELYDIDLGDKWIGAVADRVVAANVAFCEYTKNALGISAQKYFNSGVITLNLTRLRESDFYRTFCGVLSSYHFIVAPDQDCLNLICKNKVHYYSSLWNAMPCGAAYKQKPKLIHYNLSLKPWHYDGVRYEEVFWEYVKKTPFEQVILAEKQAFTKEKAQIDAERGERLIALAQAEADSPCNYMQTVILKAQNIDENIENEVGMYGFIENFTATASGIKAN